MLDNRRSMQKIALVILAVTALAFMGVSVSSAESVPLTERQIEVIRANCPTAQTQLQQLQRSDITTRISRGRDYEQLIRLMASFNSRVVLNKLDAGLLSSVTADFERQFRTFQRDYIAYSDQLSRTIDMRCSDQPVTFYDAVNETRDLRAKLGSEIKAIDTLLDVYSDALENLEAEVVAQSKGESSE